MAKCHEEAFEVILKLLDENPFVKRAAKVGFCREWTGHVIKALDEFEPAGYSYRTEAREVHLEPGLSHTFILLEIVCDGQMEPYILDGAGTAKFEPYLGPASSVPKHLENSHIDPIERYRDLKGKR